MSRIQIAMVVLAREQRKARKMTVKAAFAALTGLESNDALYLKVVPTMLEVMAGEYHTQPRERMLGHFKGALKRKKTTSPAGKLIIAGLRKAVGTSEVMIGQRSPEGAYNIAQAAKVTNISEIRIRPTGAAIVCNCFTTFSICLFIRLTS